MRGMARQGFWNVWWTLAWITAALTIAVAVLEALGAFDDLGIVLSLVGLALTMLFGLTASTRSSVGALRSDMIPVLALIGERLERIEDRLGSRLERIDNQLGSRLERIDDQLGGLGGRLQRIDDLLGERLPPRSS